MKKTKITAFLSAFAISAVTAISPLNTYAENDSPLVYDNFNTNDVNGTVTVNILENTTAEVKITFTSPEVTDEPYYIKKMTSNDSYSFDIEGRDTTENDYRNYTLSVAITGGQYEDTAVYTDTFTVPDGNDNPDSFLKFEYNFSIDDDYTGKNWDITSESKTEKNIVMHLNAYELGDLNNDGLIDAIDATAVLIEYAELSTNNESTFNKRQKLAGDINKDGIIDAVDASMIQIYYAELSTGGNPSWEDINDTPPATSITTTTSSSTITALSSNTTNTAKTTTGKTIDTTKTTTTSTTTTNSSSTITALSSDTTNAAKTTTSKTTDTAKTTTTSTTTTNSASTITTESLSIDYSSYINSVQMLEGSHDDTITFHNYYIYDINNDGIYELITEMGTCEADNQYSVYSIKNGEMIFAGDISASNSGLYEKDGKLYKNYAHMGLQKIDLISLDNGKINTETTYEKEQSETYIEYGTEINSYDWSDLSGINNIRNADITTTTTMSETTTTTIPQAQLDSAMKKLPEDFEWYDPRYCYEDINNDGVPELLIKFQTIYGMSGIFTSVFAYKNGEFTPLISLGEELYVCREKNLIRVKAYEGAEVDLFYSISEDGSATLVDSLSIYAGEYYHNDSKISSSEYNTRESEYNIMSWIEPEYEQLPLYEDCANIQNAPEDMVYYSKPVSGIVNVESGTLNMRTGAGTNYNIITSLQKNTQIQILGETNSWCYVQYSGNYGYMSREYIKYTYKIIDSSTTANDYSSYYNYIDNINQQVENGTFNGLTPISYKLYDINDDGIKEMIMYFYDNDLSVNSQTCWHIISTDSTSPFVINAGNTDSSFRVYNNKLYFTWLYHGYQSAEPVTYSNGVFQKGSTEMSWDYLSEFHEFGSQLTTYNWNDLSGLDTLS